jgi:membrane protease YdiL (CAAX protease family)
MAPVDSDERPASGDPHAPPSPKAAGRSVLRSIFVGPKGIRAGWRLALFLAIAALLGWPLRWLRGGPPPPTDTFEAGKVIVGKGLSFFVAALAAWVMSKIEKERWSHYGLPLKRAVSFDALVGLLWGFLSLSVLMLGLYIANCYQIEGLALEGRAIVGYGFLWAVAFLIVALLEEFWFRGYAQYTLCSGLGFWPAAVLLSIVFILMHVRNPGEHWLGLTDVFLIGMFLCFTLWRTGDLWFAVAMHASWDWGLSYFYSVPDSGVAASGHLFNARLEGPPWLSGGTAGPEGSALALMLHLSSFLLFSLLYPRRRWMEMKERRSATEAVRASSD